MCHREGKTRESSRRVVLGWGTSTGPPSARKLCRATLLCPWPAAVLARLGVPGVPTWRGVGRCSLGALVAELLRWFWLSTSRGEVARGRSRIASLDTLAALLLMRPRSWLASLTVRAHRWLVCVAFAYGFARNNSVRLHSNLWS